MEYETRFTGAYVLPKDKSLFDENAYLVEIVDEGAGEFVIITDLREGGKISVDAESWPHVQSLIDNLVAACREPKLPHDQQQDKKN